MTLNDSENPPLTPFTAGKTWKRAEEDYPVIQDGPWAGWRQAGATYEGETVVPHKGAVETAVEKYVESFKNLELRQRIFANMALKLARTYDAYDEDDLAKLARLNMELRQTISAIEAATNDEGEPQPDFSTPTWSNPAGGSSMPPAVRDTKKS